MRIGSSTMLAHRPRDLAMGRFRTEWNSTLQI